MSDYDPARGIRFTYDVSVEDWTKARDIARRYLPPDAGDARRIELDVQRIRDTLGLPSYRNHTVEMSCLDSEEASRIKARLTEDERRRVVFRFLDFQERSP